MFRLFRRNEQARKALRRTRESWFGRLREVLTGGGDSVDWEEVEELLISADVGVHTAVGLVERVRGRREMPPGGPLEALKEEMVRALQLPGPGPALFPGPQGPAPFVVLVVGVNGVGKTTSIAKLAHLYREAGLPVMLAAADTFRAAAIEQLQALARRVGAEVVAHRQGADPGAVVYDAFNAARARGARVLIVDTAGRLHTRVNLMEELRKVRRVLQRLDPSAPHLTLLVLDATTGQNGLAQARNFTDAVGVDGIVLAKLDGTAKGGIVLAVAEQLRLPVLFIGTGEAPEDLAPFEPREFVEALFAPHPQGVQG